MKKSNLIVVLIISLLFLAIGISNVYAIDLNLINNVRENEISSAENLSLNTTTNTSNNSGNLNGNVNTNTNYSQTNLPTTNISNVTNTTDGTLTIGNILNILLIVVGVLLILLGIAIMIRMNR